MQDPQTTSPHILGRQHLQQWQEQTTTNFFSADPFFHQLLQSLWGSERFDAHHGHLEQAGQEMASIDEAVTLADQRENLPQLQRFSGVGERIEQVQFHPAYRDVGKAIYGTRMMSVYEKDGQNLLSLALFYLSAQNGEAGHNCPVACTAGIIKVLRKVASPALAERYLPPLLDPDFDTNFTGAQFLTEIQGGSDVGANAAYATPEDKDKGTWRIHGEKWFCSNVTADLILMTARVPEQGKGTRGLGLFLVPRILEDGSLNELHIRRLKEKLGTRAMASGECDFRGALAYQIGPTDEGFHNIMRHVINTSRLYNAMAVSGNARRAFDIAWRYTQHRRAFGQPIHDFPLVQDILARMKTDLWATLAGSAQLIHLQDQAETQGIDEEAQGLLRMGLNLNKYRSSVLAHEIILQAIELLGGNGAIETFSPLPRLIRDNVVYENWEGTHNVLVAQVQRDMMRFRFHEPFFRWIQSQWRELPAQHTLYEPAKQQTEQLQQKLNQLLDQDPQRASLYMRPLLERITDLYYAASMCTPLRAAQEHKSSQATLIDDALALFFARRIQRLDATEIADYEARVQRLAQSR